MRCPALSIGRYQSSAARTASRASSSFQKNGHDYLPRHILEGQSGRQLYLAIDDEDGLFAMAQMSAIELHPWGRPWPIPRARTAWCSASALARA